MQTSFLVTDFLVHQKNDYPLAHLFNTCERLINDEAEIHHLLENVRTHYAKKHKKN